MQQSVVFRAWLPGMARENAGRREQGLERRVAYRAEALPHI